MDDSTTFMKGGRAHRSDAAHLGHEQPTAAAASAPPCQSRLQTALHSAVLSIPCTSDCTQSASALSTATRSSTPHARKASPEAASANSPRVHSRAAAAKVDITFADTAFDALFRPAGARLTRFQQLTRGTRVRVVHDRQAVLAAFEAQDDVLGLPDDWEASLGCDFIVENYDNGDSTYVLVKPGAFDETSATNAKDGKWWPYSVVVLLP